MSPSPRPSTFWRWSFRALYRVLRLLDPLVRAMDATAGLGNVVELRVPGRRTGVPRRTLVGLLHAGDDLYLGHPNGEADWMANLLAAGGGEFAMRGGEPVPFRAARLSPGEERTAAIRATWRQHPFPGNVIYWLARRHVLAAGVYVRVEPLVPASARVG